MFSGVSLADGLCGVPKGRIKLHMASYGVRKACFHIQEHTSRPLRPSEPLPLSGVLGKSG